MPIASSLRSPTAILRPMRAGLSPLSSLHPFRHFKLHFSSPSSASPPYLCSSSCPPSPTFLLFPPLQLSAGLSQLGRTADGLKPAYLALTLSGTDLGTAEPIAAFPHLQTLCLPDNRLTDIRTLGALRHLTHLDVSGNKLTQVGQ